MKAILLIACLFLMSDCPVVSISQPSTACIGEPMTFAATVTGGKAPYKYTWVGCALGDSVDIATSSAYSLTVPSVCTYTVGVNVTDAAGCSVWRSGTPINVQDCE